MNRGPKSRAFYRIQATRRLTGGGNVIKKKLDQQHKKNQGRSNLIVCDYLMSGMFRFVVKA